MHKFKFNVVTDLQYGSTGKGCIATFLASVFKPDILSTTNMANAGHTAVHSNGDKFVAKVLPSPTILNKWIQNYSPKIVIGPTAAFHLDTLFKELAETDNPQLVIHPRAGVITENHKEQESTATKHIASTMQGCGAFLADKIMRKADLKLARDYAELQSYISTTSMPLDIMRSLDGGQTVLHEGSQGFSLDISHGQGYPFCTSRSTTAMQNATDMGMPPLYLGKIYGVMRPYPIRVGNVVENGNVVGYSGDCYDDQEEITWDDVTKKSGAPYSLDSNELTTVTKRLRRVYTFSKKQLVESVAINGVTDIALNFANYIDWSCYGTNDFDNLPGIVIDFIKMVEDAAGVPVTVVGTGPALNHVCLRS